jgi:enoyl-CoA hydratase/carnithine racemase
VTAPDQLDTAVAELTASICEKPRVAVETGKRMFYEQIERDPSSAYQYATNVMAENMMAADAFEGVSAFLDKRPPKFGH